MTEATVVICAYTLERWAWLGEAVTEAADQLRRRDTGGGLMVVVDHNPELLTRATVAFSPLAVEVVPNRNRPGLSGARNTAIELAGTRASEVLVFLDDDATPRAGWLDVLLGHFDNPAVAAVGGSAHPIWPATGRPATLPARDGEPGEFDWVVGCTYAGQPTRVSPVRNLMGCNMAFRTGLLSDAGGFATELGRVGTSPLGCEETELCIKITHQNPGKQILFDPVAAVDHHVSQARTGWDYFWARCRAEGISKAAVSRRVGATDALRTEAKYLAHTLPAGLARQLHRARADGFGRAATGAAAIISGAATTGFGYLRGAIAMRTKQATPAETTQRAATVAADGSTGRAGEDDRVEPTPLQAGCRLCGFETTTPVLDLGSSPPCQQFPDSEQLLQPELTYPLVLSVCPQCLLLQIPPLLQPEQNFTEYAYFSSVSESWVRHAKDYVDQAAEDLALGPDSFVVEVAANDGYLLQHVVDRGIRCLGIEPSRNVSEAARDRGIPMLTAFLDAETGRRVAQEHGAADLVIANNVWAHIPDIVGFTRGLRNLVADDGRVSIEVHHALNLISEAQFDTIYHEHFQYWTVLAAERGLAAGGLKLVDVEQLPTHGGSIRLWAAPAEADVPVSPRVAELKDTEKMAGLDDVSGYRGLTHRVAKIRRDFTAFLIEAAEQGKTVVGYGAPGKGNTLLNFCGIRTDLVSYLVDKNPYKHGLYSPGMHLPVHPVERIAQDRPDYVWVLPWNLSTEIEHQLQYISQWGGRLVYAQPKLEIVEGSNR